MKLNYGSQDKFRQETWKYHENQNFKQLHKTRKAFQVQFVLLMYLCFKNVHDTQDESRVN